MDTIGTLHLILGDQLNRDSLLWQQFDPAHDVVWMAEVSEESQHPLSSKQRTVLFLSAMRHFAEQLESDGLRVIYFRLDDQITSFSEALNRSLQQLRPKQIRCVLPGDYRVQQQLQRVADQCKTPVHWLGDHHFIAKPGEFSQWLKGYKQPRMEYWYRYLRKSRQLLMDEHNKPCGGQWNFDKSNRKSFGKTGPSLLPPPVEFETDTVTQAVIADVERYLPKLPGTLDHFHWPVTRAQSLHALQDFIEHRLPLFGDYQDAMWTGQPWLYHARLSSSLNLKLLHPMEVIDAAISAWRDGHAPLNAVEGFVRQILGWREYVRGLYWHHRKQWPEMNALDADRALPPFYWDGETRMACLQQSIGQVLEYGYGHHIQRLMVTGLFALLFGVKPDQIHQWYLAMYVDAVAWVEVPNTLGMSQYADGGIVGSKPYIASGAYINRMSDYCSHCPYNPSKASGEHACPFTSLYWGFIDRHQELIAGNPRLGMQLINWQNKPEEEKVLIRQRCENIWQDPDRF